MRRTARTRFAVPAALPLACAAAMLLTVPAPATAQVGTAVAVTPTGEVLVLRPTSGRGRAGVLVFEKRAGEWVRAAALEPGADAEPYEGFGPALAAAADVIAAAGGDDDVRWGARIFTRSGDGWVAAPAVPVDPSAAAGPVTEAAALDMEGLMRMMAPPARTVALAPDGLTMAVWAAGEDASLVRVLRRRDDGGWERVAGLPVHDSAGAGMVRMVMDADRIVVGDPERGPAGAVRIYRRGAADAWTLERELSPGATPGAAFGTSLALEGERLAVGMPGADAVVVYRREGSGWVEDGRITGPAAVGGSTRFGQAVTWAGRGALWVGAPGEDWFRGAVYRYERGKDGAWRSAARLGPSGLADGTPAALGWTLAAAGDLVVAGAPALDGGAGGAAVIERGADGWTGPVFLPAGVELRGIASGAVRCVDGEAAGFGCGNVDLLSFVTLEDMRALPMERVTDIWGWADPETGREYALVGRNAGMMVIDVTRPEAPVSVALVRAAPASLRDIKVFDDHAFIVGDGAGDHGLVVFDLGRIRDLPPGDAPATLQPDARYDGIGSAHNLIMEPETGLAIPVGASGGGETCGGGLHMVDVSTPTAPKFAGCYTDDTGLIAPGRSHDGQCVIYRGPDADYRGRRICIASNETALRFVDVTDPATPVEIASVSYPGVAYTHQGWLTEDQRHFFQNDELDELVGTVERTRTLIWDVADLDDPILVGEHLGPDIATDHNLFIRGDRMYQANYQAGLRVVDISDPENPRDVGFFDTTPYGPNHAGFGGGAWTAYPFLPSGTVLVSSMYEGLFVLRPRPGIVP